MGYRSEVALALDAPATSVLEALAKVSEEVQTLLSDAETVTKTEEGHRYFWSWIKWYDMYKEIQLIDELLCILPCDSYGFIRLGEQSDDVEERGSPCEFDMYVSRSIEF